jgi:colicin import membrane protein
MRTKILLLLAFVSIQVGYSQVIESKMETVIIDSVRNVKAQEKAQNELAKQNAEKIKEQKAQEKALKEAEQAQKKAQQAQKKAEKAQKKAEKELRQKEKKANQRAKALRNVEKNQSRIAKQQKAIEKHQKALEKMERKGKISPEAEIKWKKKRSIFTRTLTEIRKRPRKKSERFNEITIKRKRQMKFIWRFF